MTGRTVTLNTKDITDVITEHRWSDWRKGCICGWTQRRSVGRRNAHLNYPDHVVDMLPTTQWWSRPAET